MEIESKTSVKSSDLETSTNLGRKSSFFNTDERFRASSFVGIFAQTMLMRSSVADAPLPQVNDVTQLTLNSVNVAQSREGNFEALKELGGVEGLATRLGVDLHQGLTSEQVLSMAAAFGYNQMPAAKKKYFFFMFLDALSDPTLLVLLAAAIVSLIVGVYEEPDHGWIEAVAIFIAIFLVSMITTFNDYSKELQFRKLEKTSQQDQRASVYRGNAVEQVKVDELVVGDVIKLQAGDMVPADSILINSVEFMSNESALTGESKDVRKTVTKDPFLLASCLITECDSEIRALVVGIGLHSQWGKIKADLVVESVNTPLQDKLEKMTGTIGYIGMGFAVATFIALVANIYTQNLPVAEGFISAFILCVTIVVVAIPEGLPLAVAIALAYSTQKMYTEKCFIRVLAACETMGNATNICSDKTGTLTQNSMTVVEAWIGDKKLEQESFTTTLSTLNETVRDVVTENASINRTAYYVTDKETKRSSELAKSHGDQGPVKGVIVGSKTEASLMGMVTNWGLDADTIKEKHFNAGRDKVFAFDSVKKRSVTICLHDKGVRMYCKGASEYVLQGCKFFLDAQGNSVAMTEEKNAELATHIDTMAKRALRTLVLAHEDFASLSDLPEDWEKNPPDSKNLCCDAIVGIIDPIRPDVVDAVRTAQEAGVIVRMVTGDNITTAAAIARQCGILHDNETCLEGPNFRKLSPNRLDELLPTMKVLARSSPADKKLLVMRLNGHNLPENKEEWVDMHKAHLPPVDWDQDKDFLLPGYKKEWEEHRPHGGDIVGVTGDGTNDAPALKAADVGLSMGITGTKVAQEASDIVILDDRFSSIINAIKWGRGVYDNIRKFLQFQLTVNVVALIVVFVGAVAGFGQPLNAVMMLWVNLVMDTFGALALATEEPTAAMLKRKPYKRSASLISRPMWRNILTQAAFQLTLLFVLLFRGPDLFGVNKNETCLDFSTTSAGDSWDGLTHQRNSKTPAANTFITCKDFDTFCPGSDLDCYRQTHTFLYNNTTPEPFEFEHLSDFETKCLTCNEYDYTHGSLMFNAFIFCQIFNEYVARKFEDVNMFDGIEHSPMFLFVSIFSVGSQVFLVEVGGEFVKTSHLNVAQWFITMALAALTLPVGMLMRFIPVKEDPDSFFDSSLVAVKKNDVADAGGGTSTALPSTTTPPLSDLPASVV